MTNSDIEIIKAERQKRRVVEDGVTLFKPTGTVVLTFKGEKLPTQVSLWWVKFEVDIYIFPVEMCYRCLRFGHIKSQCRASNLEYPRCLNCGESHPYAYLQEEPSCYHCRGKHQASDKDCPEWAKQKEIKYIMAKLNLSYTEAIAMVKQGGALQHITDFFYRCLLFYNLDES